MIGDIVGDPGRKVLRQKLPVLTERYKPHLIIANGENVSGGRGISENAANELFSLGIDVITMGNHTWDNRELAGFIDRYPRILRPANYPPGTPGNGWLIHELRPDLRPIAVVSLLGRSYMSMIPDCPFQAIQRVIDEINASLPGQKQPILIVDFHGESTSEKETLGFFLADKAAAVLGTHTHVQTADERILAGGAAYISDVGMTGVRDSVLGVKPQIMIERFLTQMPLRFEAAQTGTLILSGVYVGIDEQSAKATEIIRFNELDTTA